MDNFLNFFNKYLHQLMFSSFMICAFSISFANVLSEKRAKATVPTVIHVDSLLAVDPPAEKEFYIFTNEGFTDREQNAVSFVQRFYKTASLEERKFNIPASITLAQGILESGAGLSDLAVKANNYFAVKCHKKKCTHKSCSKHKEGYFTVYASAWLSFRRHSEFLQGDRYRACRGGDWLSWCSCLQDKGYAEDKAYARKLVNVIDRYRLYEFDGKNFDKNVK